jgi:hypothetical protein
VVSSSRRRGPPEERAQDEDRQRRADTDEFHCVPFVSLEPEPGAGRAPVPAAWSVLVDLRAMFLLQSEADGSQTREHGKDNSERQDTKNQRHHHPDFFFSGRFHQLAFGSVADILRLRP